MSMVTSADGTPIGFSRTGSGPGLILVDGALCYREFGPTPKIAEQLASDFTVYTYDRRGRGESGNHGPYEVRREIEDIAALVREIGDSAYLFGQSSGAVLALEAANSGLPISKLALYEPPFIVDTSRRPVPDDFDEQLRMMIDAGRPGDAVKAFMRIVDTPAFFVAIMPVMRSVWSKLQAVAHTLPYDITVMHPNQSCRPLPESRWDSLTIRTLVMDGGKSPGWMRTGVKSLADLLPDALYRTLPGQTHLVKPGVLVPALADFLSA
ncbi:alpha/beta hydrolase [Fodinicola feengrottensis]|uniref:Alpha/beta hydrolase n=1 Tax=Fodinicola feengrottensis TaxID=435914 RepID=A0ABN2G5E8_9ACTN